MKSIPTNIQDKIVTLRKIGKSHREIAKLLSVSLGSTFLYAHSISLTNEQHNKLKKETYKNGLGKLDNEKRHLASIKGGINNKINLKPKRTKEQLLMLLKNFHTTNGRIPTKRDFYSSYGMFFRAFGTWNNAIIKAGLSPNPVLFAKKYIANDGHKCDSLAEKIIDDWLNARKIKHKRNIRYINSRYTADFMVDNLYIEFFGLYGQLKSYDILMKKKLEIIKNNGLKLISLYPEDIFPTLKLNQKLAALLTHENM